MKFGSILVLLFIISGCNHPESKRFERFPQHEEITEIGSENKKEEISYKVIGVKDGDTFIILLDGKEQTVRFAHIDCPEKKQPFGKKAKQFVSDMCFAKWRF